MDYFVLLRKRIYIIVSAIMSIINLILLIFTAKSLTIMDVILVSIFMIFLCGISICILSRIIYFIISIRKFPFLNNKINIKTTLRGYILLLGISVLFYGTLNFAIFIDSDSSAIPILIGSFSGIAINLCTNRFLLFNDEFIIYDMKVFYIKDISDCWLCKDSNNMDSLKILLNNKETLSVIRSSYIDLDSLHNFIKDHMFIKNKLIEYGITEDSSI